MKTRRSLDISKQPAKKRKQSKRYSLDPCNLEKFNQEDKENEIEDQTKENIPPEDNDGKLKTRRKNSKEKFYREMSLSLKANNRALATALEETRVRINAAKQENLILKRQIHCERQSYIERVEKEVEQKVKCQFKAVEDCLRETISKLLEGSKLLSSAMDMVSKPINTITATPMSCAVPDHSCNTTPPPDVPDYMEVTTAELIPMETTTTELGNIETIESKETDMNDSHFQVLIQTPIPVMTAQECEEEHEVFSDMMLDVTQADSSLDKPMRNKRRSSVNISYAMPSLRSKLRRGDPFTDPFFQETLSCTKSKRKGRMSTGCIRKKPAYALRNLTNIITEEKEA